MPHPAVAVVTDSSCGLDLSLAASFGVRIVPIRVVMDGRETSDDALDRDALLSHLRRGLPVHTLSPEPRAFSRAFRDCAAQGASSIVAVVSGSSLSDAVLAAQSAAGASPVPVTVIDSGAAALSLGLAALAAASIARDGGEAHQVRAAALEASSSARMWITVSRDHLRASGRLPDLLADVDGQSRELPIVQVTRNSQQAVSAVRDPRGAAGAIAELVAREAGGLSRPIAMEARESRSEEARESASEEQARAHDGGALFRGLGEAALGAPVLTAPASTSLVSAAGPDVVAMAVADMPPGFASDVDVLAAPGESSLALSP